MGGGGVSQMRTDVRGFTDVCTCELSHGLTNSLSFHLLSGPPRQRSASASSHPLAIVGTGYRLSGLTKVTNSNQSDLLPTNPTSPPLLGGRPGGGGGGGGVLMGFTSKDGFTLE